MKFIHRSTFHAVCDHCCEKTKEKKPVKDKQEQIDEIMDTFDFEKVYQVMRTMGITWGDEITPSVIEIKKAARRLLKDVFLLLESGHVAVVAASFGGFRAEMDRNTGTISLEFVLERAEA